jgi:MoaA/NifB/PqqE/SkfB family radical SAM enzyme
MMRYYYHPPGELSRSSVMDVGLKCTHSCKFCYYSFLGGDSDQFRGMRHAPFRDGSVLEQLLGNLHQNGFLGFDVTGGEPTLHPKIVSLVEYATRLGLFSRIITLGQFLTRKMRGAARPLIHELLEAGLTNFLFSFHSSDEAEFKNLTGESLPKQLDAMDYLGARNFQFCTNTVVIAENAARLPEIAEALTKSNTYLHNFIIMNAYYEWNVEGRVFGIMPRYTDLLPPVREAISILEASDIGCNIRYAPLCGLPGLERHIVGVTGVRYDPYEWMNRETHFGMLDPNLASMPWIVAKGHPQEEFRFHRIDGSAMGDGDAFAMRGPNANKIFNKVCENCALLHACDGFDPKYFAQFGTDELCPYDDSGLFGALTASRRTYIPPFLVKLHPFANMREVNKRFLNPAPPSGKAKVSVVVTAYNKAEAVVRSVRSALDQSYPNFEVVIVDDGSTDGTLAVLDKSGVLADSRVKVYRQSRSGQPATARNVGIMVSVGELILPLDADDWIARTYVAEAVAVMAQNPAVSIVYCDALYSRSGLVRAREYDYSRLMYENHLSYCSLYKRIVFDDIGGYRTNVRGVEDWDFWVAAGLRGHFGKRIPRPLFHYTEHDDGVYALDVLPNLETKFAQIVLNNSQAYQPDRITWAKQKLQGSSVELATTPQHDANVQ